MKATLISVGTEILMGQTMNTNVMFLSQELNKISVDVMYHHTVGDNLIPITPSGTLFLAMLIPFL